MKDWNECSIKEKLERWTQAERVLKGLPKHVRTKHWNMAHWGIVTECGTVCCAAGHCGLDPWFRKRGFKLRPTHIDSLIQKFVYEDVQGENITLQVLENNYEMHHGQGGFEDGVEASEFFGSGSYHIFGNDMNRTVDEVIQEIRQYIKKMKDNITDIKNRRAQEIKKIRAESVEKIKSQISVVKSAIASIDELYNEELSNIGG